MPSFGIKVYLCIHAFINKLINMNIIDTVSALANGLGSLNPKGKTVDIAEKIAFLTSGRGVTSTLANHLCNIAKEEMQSIQADLDNIGFQDVYLESLEGAHSKAIRQGYKIEELRQLMLAVERQAKLTAFIAYFRQSIKQKEALLDKLRAMRLDEYERLHGLEPLVHTPIEEPDLTLDEYIRTLPLADYEEYYKVEAVAATYGKVIHPGQALSVAKTELNKRAKNSIEVESSGDQTLIRRYSPTIELAELDKIFFEQQSQYRDHQARSNKLKAQYEQELYLHNQDKHRTFLKAQEAYRLLREQRGETYEQYRRDECQRISGLKIVVPERLLPTFEYLRSLGKDGSAE